MRPQDLVRRHWRKGTLRLSDETFAQANDVRIEIDPHDFGAPGRQERHAESRAATKIEHVMVGLYEALCCPHVAGDVEDRVQRVGRSALQLEPGVRLGARTPNPPKSMISSGLGGVVDDEERSGLMDRRSD